MKSFDFSDTSHSTWQYIGIETKKKSFVKRIYYDGTQISACFFFGFEVRINIVCFAFFEPIESIQSGQGGLFQMPQYSIFSIKMLSFNL